jgi:pimeloyl-ACP methyl ester carboxylesterase
MDAQTLFIQVPEKSTFRKLAYTQWGDEKNEKVLFCVHGLSRNGRDFDYLAKELAADYRVICMDVVGRGKSDWFEKKSKYNYRTYVADVFALVDELGIKKVDWVGTSMGGIIAMAVAVMRPLLINKLVLNDIGPFVPGEALDRIVEYVNKAPLFNSREEAEAALKARMTTFGIKKEEHWQHIFTHSVEPIGDKFRFAYDPKIVKKPFILLRVLAHFLHPSKWRKMPDVKLWLLWKAIYCPILLLRGEISDILLPDTVQKMQEQKPSMQVVEFKGIGHAPMLMEIEQIEVVKKWLLDK